MNNADEAKLNSGTDEKQRIAATLDRIKNRLLVFSGKGGVGKSTVAANLAFALSRQKLKVGLLDIDIHGPNLAKMLGAEGKQLESDPDNRMRPIRINDNLVLISMSFLLNDPSMPVIWRGPMKMKVISQFISDVNWGDLDWLIIDSPPGTGDEPLSVAQLIPATGALIVTTPQEVSLLDSRKAINFARRLNLPINGIVENMSGLVCPHCGKGIDLFSKGGGKKMALEMSVPFLGSIPFDPAIVELADKGKPIIGNITNNDISQAFEQIAARILKPVN